MASRSLVKFVDSIVAAPGVLLDLNQAGGPLMIGPEGIDLSPPPLRRSVVAGFLGVDGDPITATAAGNRTIKMSVKLVNVSAEQAATAVQNLTNRLSVDGILMVQLDGMTKPVFFQTYAAPDYTLKMLRLLVAENTSVVLEIPAMAYGLGPKVTLPTVVVNNDPSRGYELITNGGFETTTTGWSPTGGTFGRSNAQFHEGSWSGLLTPDGVTATVFVRTTVSVPVVQGQPLRFSGWLRCAVARSVTLQLEWRDGADAVLSSSPGSVISVSANTWTYFSGIETPPSSTAGARLVAVMGSTPAASNLLYLDEMKLSATGPVQNLNPYFETNAASWTVTGGTFVRSTAQFHEGTASGLVTPDGVTATVSVDSDHSVIGGGSNGQGTGQVYSIFKADVWVRCAVARNIDVQIAAWNTSDVFIASGTTTAAVAANTWTPVTVTLPTVGMVAFPKFMSIRVQMTGTPAASNTLHIDEAVLYRIDMGNAPAGGMCFDIANVLGDVETPLFMTLGPGLACASGTRKTLFSVRRHGDPTALYWYVPAEVLALNTDTTRQAFDSTASGPASNFVRCTFATNTLTERMTIQFPGGGASGPETRGLYTLYARVRHTTGADTFTVQCDWGASAYNRTTDPVTIPADVGSGAPNWFYVPIATVQAPPGIDPVTDGYSNVTMDASQLLFSVKIQRASGAGSLDIDHFLFVPADDRTAVVDWHAADSIGLSAYICDARRTAIYAIDNQGRLIDIGGRQIAGGFPMLTPGTQTNRIYVIRDVSSGAGSTQAVGTGDSIGGSITVTPAYFPRYRVIRPAAT
jgi:hypothetical protein